MIGARYVRMFGRLEGRREGAFIPFLMLGDPDPDLSARLLDAAVEAGADALEVGIPFSDPVADGPVIQAAATRALAAGADVATCFRLIAGVRSRHPELPIGLLVYANLIVRRGLPTFYRDAAAAGVDSVLVADVPLAEVEPFVTAATEAGVAPVLIVPPNAERARIAGISAVGRGYSYVTSRSGVTGDDRRGLEDLRERIALLAESKAAPAVVGFGIATADQVRAALDAGAAGAIAGSVLVRRIERFIEDPDRMIAEVASLVAELKSASRPPLAGIATGKEGAEN